MSKIEPVVQPAKARDHKEVIGVWPLMMWAFQRECAQIETGHDPWADLPGFGLEYVLIERAKLGCRIDGGGVSPVHPDADIVADAIAVLPPERGGLKMAHTLAELARSGCLPDCMLGERPRIEPVSLRKCKHGVRATTECVGVERWVSRGRQRERAIYACPVRYAPSQAEIAGARRRYMDVIMAMMHVRDTLRIGAPLSCYEVSDALPPMCPWQKTP